MGKPRKMPIIKMGGIHKFGGNLRKPKGLMHHNIGGLQKPKGLAHHSIGFMHKPKGLAHFGSKMHKPKWGGRK